MLAGLNRTTADTAQRPQVLHPSDPLVIDGVTRGPGQPRFSLRLERASCATIAGPSGSGKSTLLRLIADLDPGLGTARIGDQIRELTPADEWRRQVIYVASDSGWWGSPVSIHMADLDHARRLLPALGLANQLMDAAPDNISSGERQRLALLRAIVLRPRFLLLDEPTSNLDQTATMQVETLLMQLKRDGVGLLVVSHDPEQIARIADRRYVISSCGLSEELL